MNTKHGQIAALVALLAIAQSASMNGQTVAAGPGPGQPPSIFVERGDPQTAIAYYRRIGAKIQLPLVDSTGPLASADMNMLLRYLGFVGLSAKDFETLDSKTLMPSTDGALAALASRVENPILFKKNFTPLNTYAGLNILVTRFFAPKIVNYINQTNPALPPDKPFAPGWRKLVILKSRNGSLADQAGIESASILFNYIKADISADPFAGNLSSNNQVILVPKAAKFLQDKSQDAAFFAVFLTGPAYKLGLALESVAFDLPGAQKYFIPTACAQCHGHDGFGDDGPYPSNLVFPKARLNYLDTDQWHDAKALDFPELKQSPNAVLFDGGTSVGANAYRLAMGVFVRGNVMIRGQNATVNTTDFKIRAVEQWKRLHGQVEPIPIERRILNVSGVMWDRTKSEEMELLGLLNRYCFRCHSTVRFNVFDKASVLAVKSSIEPRLKANSSSAYHMPQGRVLPQNDLDRIVALVRKL